MSEDLDLKKTTFLLDKYTRQDIEFLMHSRRVPTVSALVRSLIAEAARQDRVTYPELARQETERLRAEPTH